MSIAGTGGQCLMAPPEMRDGKIPVTLLRRAFGLLIIYGGIRAVLLL